MQLKTYFIKKMPYLAILSLVFGLYSCGSYQYVGVDNDGIYGETPRTVQYEEAVVNTNTKSNNNYYQNYFKNKSLESEYMMGNGEIFTDIDAYESDNYVQNDTLYNDYQGYAGWGQSNSNVTINIHSDYGWGFNNYWWNRPYFNRWGYSNGRNNWGYGYDPFWNAGFYGGYYNNWAFANPWSYGYYGNPYRYYGNYGYNNYYYGNGGYYNRGNVAYSATRRGSNYANNSGSINNNAYSTSRRSNTTYSGNVSKYNTARRSSVNTSTPNSAYTTRQYNSNGTRVYSDTQRRTTYSTPSTNSTSRSSSAVRRSSSTIYTPSNSNNSGNYSRSSSSSSNSTYTPSRSSNSSSSSTSSSSSRSSSGSSGSSRSSGSSGGGGRRG